MNIDLSTIIIECKNEERREKLRESPETVERHQAGVRHVTWMWYNINNQKIKGRVYTKGLSVNDEKDLTDCVLDSVKSVSIYTRIKFY